jgi:putative ATPase
MVIYLATAPKSNRSYQGLNAAMEAARATPAAQVPMHIRNAPTRLMKELGYHEGYQYAHSVPEAYIPQEYLPEELRGTVFYEPGPFGFEKEVAKRLQWWADLKAKVSTQASPPGDKASPGSPPSQGSTGKIISATGSPDTAKGEASPRRQSLPDSVKENEE